MLRSIARLAGVLLAFIAPFIFAPQTTALAADPPDFSNVADILGGQRRLLPVDDLVLGYHYPDEGPSVEAQLFPTENGMLGEPVGYGTVDGGDQLHLG